jgi:hypothetical protein
MVVYVLVRAKAVGFYKAQGAQVAGEGTFTVGCHTERALCLRVALGCD